MVSPSGNRAGFYRSRRFRIPWYVELIAAIAVAYVNLSPLAGVFSVTKIVLY